MNKSDGNKVVLNLPYKHIVLNIERILKANSETVKEYEIFLFNYVAEAIKDNCIIYFLFEANEEILENNLNDEKNKIFFKFKNVSKHKDITNVDYIKRIKKIFFADKPLENPDKFFYFFKSENENFESFIKKDFFIKFFDNQNSLFVFDNPKSVENLFFNKFFTVFLSSLSINVDNGDYRSAKKICQCLIDDDISNWDYDRVNYEFISFLELLID